MITTLRREVRNLARKAHQTKNDTITRRIKEAEALLDQFSGDENLNRDKLDSFVDVVCDSIRVKDVRLSIPALQSLKSYVESDFINAKSLQLITETVTKIDFSSDQTENADGYHEAIRVCCSMVKCRASAKLTNESISEVIIFCFRVVKYISVEWLRSKAERSLLSITKVVFRRLSDFPDDPHLKPSYRIRLRLADTSSQSTFKELADQSSNLADNSPTPSSTLRIINERNNPYNLAFINDFFCYLASLINPHYDAEKSNNFERKISLGLKLLKIVFNESLGDIGRKTCLTYVTRNNICFNILSILKVIRSPRILSETLNLAVDIFTEYRHHLKYQFEAFLERLMEMLVASSDHNIENSITLTTTNGSLELRSDVLNSILELFRNINHFPHELYYNYDCDPYSSNIYENLIQICSKNCFQHSTELHFTPVQLTSFKCLQTNLADVYRVQIGKSLECFVSGLKLEFDDKDTVTDDMLHRSQEYNSSKVRLRFPRTYRDLHETKKRKRLLWLALDKFNSRPKDGIQFIRDNGLIDNNKDLVQFLKDNLRVDKKVLGEYLSKEENRVLRESFIKSLDFTNLRIDEALRAMLEKFRLPGESQLIERILDVFSVHWFEQNKGILQNSDSALSLAYAIIMLNVDQHSKKVKPMTCDEFDRNLLGPKSERIYDRKLLDQIYTNIRDNEIVLPDEQMGQVRQRYLWKCTMVKSERVDAIYWITGEQSGILSSQVDQHHVSETLGYEQNNNLDSHSLPIISSPIIRADETTNLPDATVLVISEPCIVSNHIIQEQQHGHQYTHCETLGHIDTLPLVEVNKILFEIMWSPTVAALSFIFDKIDTNLYPELSRQIVDEGFIRFAHLCAQHGHLDNLVVSLCKFTTDLSPVPHNHSGQRHLMSDKNSLAALSLLSIIRDYANCMRDSWSNIVRNILQWYCSKCIDDVVQVDDFALQRKLTLRMREVKKSPSTMNQQSSTFLRSVYTYFAGQPTNEGKLQNDNNCAPSAIQVLIQTIQDAVYCQESLNELINALTTASVDGDPEEVEDVEVFKLEIFTQVILNNKEQAMTIWPRIRAYFARQSSICGQSSWLGERIISAAFRVAIQFKPKPEVFSLLGHIIATLDAEIVRGEHTYVALMTLTELHSPTVSMDAKDLEACFNQVIFPFLDKVLDGCDPISMDRTLNRAINLLSKIFLKHHKLLKELQTFALLWYAILDLMEKYIKANNALKEATFELVKNMVLVMDNEQCMSVEMKDITRTKFMFWEFQSGSDY